MKINKVKLALALASTFLVNLNTISAYETEAKLEKRLYREKSKDSFNVNKVSRDLKVEDNFSFSSTVIICSISIIAFLYFCFKKENNKSFSPLNKVKSPLTPKLTSLQNDNNSPNKTLKFALKTEPLTKIGGLPLLQNGNNSPNDVNPTDNNINKTLKFDLETEPLHATPTPQKINNKVLENQNFSPLNKVKSLLTPKLTSLQNDNNSPNKTLKIALKTEPLTKIGGLPLLQNDNSSPNEYNPTDNNINKKSNSDLEDIATAPLHAQFSSQIIITNDPTGENRVLENQNFSTLVNTESPLTPIGELTSLQNGNNIITNKTLFGLISIVISIGIGLAVFFGRGYNTANSNMDLRTHNKKSICEPMFNSMVEVLATDPNKEMNKTLDEYLCKCEIENCNINSDNFKSERTKTLNKIKEKIAAEENRRAEGSKKQSSGKQKEKEAAEKKNDKKNANENKVHKRSPETVLTICNPKKPFNLDVGNPEIDCNTRIDSLVEALFDEPNLDKVPNNKISNQMDLYLCECELVDCNSSDIDMRLERKYLLVYLKVIREAAAKKAKVLAQLNKRTGNDLSKIFDDNLFPIAKRINKIPFSFYKKKNPDYYIEILDDILIQLEPFNNFDDEIINRLGYTLFEIYYTDPTEILTTGFSKENVERFTRYGFFRNDLEERFRTLKKFLDEFIGSFDSIIDKIINYTTYKETVKFSKIIKEGNIDNYSIKEVFKYFDELKRKQVNILINQKVDALNLKKELTLIEIRTLCYKIEIELLKQQEVKSSDRDYSNVENLLKATELIIKRNGKLLDDLDDEKLCLHELRYYYSKKTYFKLYSSYSFLTSKELSSKLFITNKKYYYKFLFATDNSKQLTCNKELSSWLFTNKELSSKLLATNNVLSSRLLTVIYNYRNYINQNR